MSRLSLPALHSAFLSVLFGVLACSNVVSAATSDTGVVDSEPKNPLGYIPSTGLALMFGSVYLLTVGVFIILARRWWARYMLTIMISAFVYAAGLYTRIIFKNNVHSLGLFIVMNMLTVLSPCGFIATVYMLLGRLAIHLEAEDLLLIKPNLITKLFLTSDIITLIVQGAAGSMVASSNIDTAKLGTKSIELFLYGLIIQLVSFTLYMFVFASFVYRVKSQRSKQWLYRPDGIRRHWLALVIAMAISCVGILIRSIFRTAENAEGFGGKLASSEGHFYALDCLPLWIAITVFALAWPPAHLTGYSARSTLGEDSIELRKP
ncbi:hypothetical protein BDV93DRAFT_561867 [Ceratobasidium sp. AG-I]|nr:hypothetical protein BDV93DRAFT_561867 [Ceratobasidium sp. AG-I]